MCWIPVCMTIFVNSPIDLQEKSVSSIQTLLMVLMNYNFYVQIFFHQFKSKKTVSKVIFSLSKKLFQLQRNFHQKILHLSFSTVRFQNQTLWQFSSFVFCLQYSEWNLSQKTNLNQAYSQLPIYISRFLSVFTARDTKQGKILTHVSLSVR